MSETFYHKDAYSQYLFILVQSAPCAVLGAGRTAEACREPACTYEGVEGVAARVSFTPDTSYN